VVDTAITCEKFSEYDVSRILLNSMRLQTTRKPSFLHTPTQAANSTSVNMYFLRYQVQQNHANSLSLRSVCLRPHRSGIPDYTDGSGIGLRRGLPRSYHISKARRSKSHGRNHRRRSLNLRGRTIQAMNSWRKSPTCLHPSLIDSRLLCHGSQPKTNGSPACPTQPRNLGLVIRPRWRCICTGSFPIPIPALRK